jgi:hypothetical protein
MQEILGTNGMIRKVICEIYLSLADKNTITESHAQGTYKSRPKDYSLTETSR